MDSTVQTIAVTDCRTTMQNKKKDKTQKMTDRNGPRLL